MMNDTEGVETSNIYFFYAPETHMYTHKEKKKD